MVSIMSHQTGGRRVRLSVCRMRPSYQKELKGSHQLDLLMSEIPVYSQIAILRSSSPRTVSVGWLIEGYVVAPTYLGEIVHH
jgi:hypothetical protein